MTETGTLIESQYLTQENAATDASDTLWNAVQPQVTQHKKPASRGTSGKHGGRGSSYTRSTPSPILSQNQIVPSNSQQDLATEDESSFIVQVRSFRIFLYKMNKIRLLYTLFKLH